MYAMIYLKPLRALKEQNKFQRLRREKMHKDVKKKLKTIQN